MEKEVRWVAKNWGGSDEYFLQKLSFFLCAGLVHIPVLNHPLLVRLCDGGKKAL